MAVARARFCIFTCRRGVLSPVSSDVAMVHRVENGPLEGAPKPSQALFGPVYSLLGLVVGLRFGRCFWRIVHSDLLRTPAVGLSEWQTAWKLAPKHNLCTVCDTIATCVLCRVCPTTIAGILGKCSASMIQAGSQHLKVCTYLKSQGELEGRLIIG